MNPESIVRVRVDRFLLASIALKPEVIGALLQLNLFGAGIHSTEQILDRFLDLVFDAIPATRGAVCLVGRDPEKFEFTTYRGETFDVEPELAAECYRERNAIRSTEGPSFLFAPLRVFENNFGVVCLENPEPGIFTTTHFNLFIGAAGIAAIKLENIRYTERLESENQRLHEEIDRLYGIVGDSACMARVEQIIDRVAPAESTVLILGESGTGKELAARAIHRRSPRRKKPFITVNCAAIPDTLIESELFGHEKGAFTGALTQQIGKIEAADGGTIFLDEIGEMSMPAQAAMLRVLQEKEVQRVGSTRTIKVDVRVIAATNRNLEERVQEKRFRPDLFYRLKVIELQMPPLRHRREDFPLLTDYFVRKYCQVRVVSGVTPEARRILAAHHWPGNVRELQNTIENVLVLGRSEFIQAEDLPFEMRKAVTAVGENGASPKRERLDVLSIERALEAAKGEVPAAAKMLDLSSGYLYRLIRDGRVKPPDAADRR